VRPAPLEGGSSGVGGLSPLRAQSPASPREEDGGSRCWAGLIV
jgi:hypothetical protein